MARIPTKPDDPARSQRFLDLAKAAVRADLRKDDLEKAVRVR